MKMILTPMSPGKYLMLPIGVPLGEDHFNFSSHLIVCILGEKLLIVLKTMISCIFSHSVIDLLRDYK